jgi:gas vesicle protein GvpO
VASGTAQDKPRRLRQVGDNEQQPSTRSQRRITAAAAARRAREQFEELTQTPIERVTGVDRSDQGWVVTVEGLEMRRIPETMDVLGVYEMELSRSGTVAGWRRVGRHHRSQVQEG